MSAELLRSLLPRVYWMRDHEHVLAGLVDALAVGYDELALELEALYDDLFMETCDPRYLPAFGDQLGVEGLAAIDGPGVGDRAWVGRIAALRRGKGTLATTREGVAAATGWAAGVEDGRALTATTNVTPLAMLAGRPTTPPQIKSAAISGKPIVAGIPAAAGPRTAPSFPAPATVGVSVWRLRAYPVRNRTPAPAHDAPRELHGRAFRFHPLGYDCPLFKRDGLPLPLTVAELAGDTRAVTIHGIRHTGVRAGDLSHWRPEQHQHAQAVVDPVLGRLLLADVQSPVVVDYAYGFAGELGGGPYGSADDYVPRPGMNTQTTLAQDTIVTVDTAILIADSATHPGPFTITLEPGRALRIASAPEEAPTLAGDLHVTLGAGSRLELSGLLIGGTITAEGSGTLVLEHSTLAPRPRSLTATGTVALTIAYAILGGLHAEGDAAVQASILDGPVTVRGALDLQQVTASGPVSAATLIAEDCILPAGAKAPRGVIHTSCVPPGPRRHGCTHERPRFTSTHWPDPGFGQLDARCPHSIAAGARRGTEMGAYNWLQQPSRFARLPFVLQELLPAGVGASVEYRT